MLKAKVFKLSFALTCMLQAARGISANIQASPNLVAAEPVLLSVMLETEQSVPAGGGFRISTPTAFISEQLECRLLEPQSVTIQSCTLDGGSNAALLVLGGKLEAFEQVYLEVSGARNPASTSKNTAYSVSSFDQSKAEIESSYSLALTQLVPATLTDFAVVPESDKLGETTALVIELKVGLDLPCASDGYGCALLVAAPPRNPFTTSLDRELVFDEAHLSCQTISAVSIIMRQASKLDWIPSFY